MRTVRQFEVAGHEIGPFITISEPIEDHTKAIYFDKREESKEAADAIYRTIEEAADHERIPVKINWKNKVGSLSIDDSPQLVYRVVFVDTEARDRYACKLEGGRIVPV